MVPFRATRTVTSEDACAVHHRNTRCRRALESCLSQDRRFAQGDCPEFSWLGGAAHWKYKERVNGGKGTTDSHDDADLAWLAHITDWQAEPADPNEFLDSLRFEIGMKEMYVFTPHGKVIGLPAGETPVDFTYAVHTNVGNRTMGSKVTAGLALSVAHSAAAASSRCSPLRIRTSGQARLGRNPSQPGAHDVKSDNVSLVNAATQRYSGAKML